ncbi:MAG: GSCFA domain-containing protein [Bacteroidales bacterium]|nr:GSCFA domain-containing protein [Bacteroidales bacterium]
MLFKTTIDVPHASFEISHAQKGMAIGSCFTTNIGNRLLAAKFPILVNPLGTVYNPVSIAQTIDLLLGEIPFDEQQIFFANDVWQSYYLHTSFSSVNKQEVLQSFNNVRNEFLKRFQSVDYLFLTLGTAWVYELNETKQIVNNCHKTPASQFNRRKLSVEECVSILGKSIARLRRKNPDLHVIFTVSPIRHWKDGAHENQVSKATLFLAIDELQKTAKNIGYFPAYELLMDDLRDYRFYDEDMLHPSATAVEYIWETFSKTYFSKETIGLISQIGAIHKAIEHRPFNAESSLYKTFIQNTLRDCETLSKENPFLDFSKDITILQQKL